MKSEETKEEAEAANEKKEDVFVELKAAETNAETENPEVVKEDVFVELKAAEMKEETPAETKAAEPKEESKKADPFDELEKKMDQNMADPNLPGAQPSTDPPLFEMKEVSAPANN